MSLALTRNRRIAAETFSADAIHATFAAATDAQWAEGAVWYQTAHAGAADLADAYGLTTRQAAGIIAALSPQTEWTLNLTLAADLCATGTAGHYRNALDKAQAILAGAEPLDVLGGPKVRSFFRNIAEPDRPGPVTIDRHAVAIAAGTDTSTYLRTHPKLLDRKGIYRLVAGLYRSAAREYPDLHPHTLQAVCWLAHRARLSRGTF